MCDIVLEYEAASGARHVLVVEAKALGKPLGIKELNFSYYLDIEEIAAFGENRHLMFLIDGALENEVKQQLAGAPPNVGLITWQDLGGLQIRLARELSTREGQSSLLMASALQYQFSAHGIIPNDLSFDYLKEEPSMGEIDALPKYDRQEMRIHGKPLWRLNDL